MLTRLYLLSLLATWGISLGLWLCWGSITRMIAFLFVFACYLLFVLANLIDLEHIESHLLPKRFQLVGATERRWFEDIQ